MTQIVFVCLFIILATSCLADLECVGNNEQERTCDGDCNLRVCPTHQDCDSSCKENGGCASVVCDCRFNYKRAKNGSCIPASECPPYKCDGENEEFVACAPLCPTDDCSQATPDGRCPLPGVMLFVVECEPKCRCIKGYWRKDGICVPYDQCPEVATVN